MGAGAGFDYLAQAGAQNAARQSAHKQQLSDEERQAHYDQLTQGIQGAQTKLATLAPGSPEYASTMDDITKAHGMLTDLFHPSTGPGALAHLGRIVSEKWLHKPAPAQTELSRPGEIPAMTLPGGGGTLPAQAGPLIPHPVPIPTAAQAKQQTNAFMTRFGIEATPQDPMKTAAQTADLNREQQGKTMDWQQDWAKRHNIGDEALQELTQHQLGIPVAKVAKPLTGAKPYQAASGQWFIDAQDPTSGEIIAQPMPANYVPPPAPNRPLSNAATQRQEYASAHGLDPTKPLPWKDEIAFQKQLFSAHNPYAGQRMDLATKSFGLREEEAGFKDFLALQKQLTPLQRTAGTAANVENYVKQPTGPGDVALTLAFFDAIKTTGVRFTKQEQDFILGSRGLMEGFQAKYDQGFSGTVMGPQQRQLVGEIIKKAASVAQHQQDTLIGGAGQFRPAVAAAAGGAKPDAGKKHSLSKAMALPFNKGKTEAQVRTDLESHGYEVVP